MTIAEFIDGFYSHQQGVVYIVDECFYDEVWDALDKGATPFNNPNGIEVMAAFDLTYTSLRCTTYLREDFASKVVKHLMVDEQRGYKYLLVEDK